MVNCGSMPGVDVRISIGDELIPEYHDRDEDSGDERTVIRYVEAKPNQHFAIDIQVDREHQFEGTAIAFEIKVDGRSTALELFRISRVGKGLLCKGVRDSDTTIKEYRFASVDLRPAYQPDVGRNLNADDIGSIKVVCRYVNILWRIASRPSDFQLPKELGPVSERCVKGKAVLYNVEFGVSVPNENGVNFYETELVEGQPNPAATYVFLYRSRDALESQRLLTPTSSPEPPQTPITAIDLERNAELDKMLEELRKKQAVLERDILQAQSAVIEHAASSSRKRTREDAKPYIRQVAQPAQPHAGDTLLELDDDGNIVDQSGSDQLPPKKRIVIELDD